MNTSITKQGIVAGCLAGLMLFGMGAVGNVGVAHAATTHDPAEVVSRFNQTVSKALGDSGISLSMLVSGDNSVTSHVPQARVSWENGDAPATFGNDATYASVLDAKVVKSPQYGWLLVIDFEFTNESEQAENLINSSVCSVNAYQNGLSLNGPGITSEQGVYDYNDAFTQARKGGCLHTQLVWVLNDLGPVEMDFGGWGSTSSYTKTLLIEADDYSDSGLALP